MNTPVVLITGALTGIGRATAWPSRKKVRASLSRVDATKPAKNWSPNSAALGRGGRILAYRRAPRRRRAKPGR